MICPFCGDSHPVAWTSRDSALNISVKFAFCGREGRAYQVPQPTAETIAGYGDQLWQRGLFDYYKPPQQERRTALQLKLLVGLIGPSTRILDVGAGIGHLVKTLREKGHIAFGTSNHPISRQQANDLYGIELWPAIPDEIASFDLVCMFHTIEHVLEPSKLMKQIARVLKPGGKLVITTPRWVEQGVWEHYSAMHPILYSDDGLYFLIEASGFEPLITLCESSQEIVGWTEKQ